MSNINNPAMDPARPFNGTRPAEVVREDFYDTIDDIVKHSGTAFPSWNRADPKSIDRNDCQVGSSQGHKLSRTLEGGPIVDPKEAVTAVRDHWEALGYTIGRVAFDPEPHPGGDISARTPFGAFVEFLTSPNGSMIVVKSECTLDPSMSGVPAPRPSSTPTG